MRAIALDYERRSLKIQSEREPGPPGPGEVLVEIQEVGICGTDRDLARFKFGYPPLGDSSLILGHEALGRVLAAGPGVTRVRNGDWVVPSVRRSCGLCEACSADRRDLCLSGKYTERGIMGAHGYLCGLALDREEDLFVIPESVSDAGVLLEPLAVAEKAVDTALSKHGGQPRTALVVGGGPIGILSALVLLRRGLESEVASIEPAGGERARLIERTGARYTNTPSGAFDVVIEAAGSPLAMSTALRALAPQGVITVLGAVSIEQEAPLRQLILKNQTITGSVNASPAAWRSAVADLATFDKPLLRALIHRRAFEEAPASIGGVLRNEPKTVHVVYNG